MKLGTLIVVLLLSNLCGGCAGIFNFSRHSNPPPTDTDAGDPIDLQNQDLVINGVVDD